MRPSEISRIAPFKLLYKTTKISEVITSWLALRNSSILYSFPFNLFSITNQVQASFQSIPNLEKNLNFPYKVVIAPALIPALTPELQVPTNISANQLKPLTRDWITTAAQTQSVPKASGNKVKWGWGFEGDLSFCLTCMGFWIRVLSCGW